MMKMVYNEEILNTWAMNPLIIRWKYDPLKFKGFPVDFPMPFSPAVERHNTKIQNITQNTSFRAQP